MRRTLEELLSHTLLFTASPKPQRVPASFPLSALAGGRPDVAKGHSAASRKIWEFALNELDSVRDATVRSRVMRDMRMRVCREIKWGDVKVTSQGKTLTLPLSEKFLLETHYLADGVVAESDQGCWQLPMQLDQSFHRLFGYQFEAGHLRALTPAEFTSPDLMSSSPASGRPHEGMHSKAPLRILVCMALGCAKERNDFEPGGVLGAARLIPHLMLVANLSVESMEATVQLTREPTTTHTRMGEEEMSPRISTALFTDRNHTLHPFPAWNNLFDYYWIDPPIGTEIKAVRTDRPYAREKAGLIQEAVEEATSRGTSRIAYKPRTVTKVPRQGEFDNIHMAPKMKLPPAVARKQPTHWPTETTMAPFCVHDCFHIHWRWSRPRIDINVVAPKWVRGWSGNEPYREAGAPMVHPNQDVSIKLLGTCGLSYTAKIHAPAAGQWQIVMHHGAAYALTYDSTTEGLLLGHDLVTTDLRGESRGTGTWANFYWHLRYLLVRHPLREVMPIQQLAERLGAHDTYGERLSWDSGNHRAARNL